MRKSMISRKLWVGSLLAVLGIGCGAFALAYARGGIDLEQIYTTQAANKQNDLPNDVIPIVVEVERLVHVDTWNAKSQYSGILKAKRTSDLGFERPGRIERIRVEKGDRVIAGQILATLNTDQIESQIQKLRADRNAAEALLVELKAGPRQETVDASRANVREREAELQMAKKRYERRRGLVNTEAISTEDFEQSQTAVLQLEAARVAAQKNLEDLQLGTRIEKIRTQEAAIAALDASIDVTKIDIDHSFIVSPFSGVVIQRQIDEGVVVSPGLPVCTVSENESMQAHFGLPPQVAHGLKIGCDLLVLVRNKELKAALKSIVPQVEADTLTSEVVVTIAPGQDSMFMSGDIARLELLRSETTEGYWLNSSAVMQGTRGLWECYVVEMEPSLESGRIARRAIEILHADGDRVLARGAIHSGDLVVRSAVHRLVVGQIVKPQEEVR